MERQAEDAADAAGHGRHEHPTGALEGVGAGLVERLAGRQVPLDVSVGEDRRRSRRSTCSPSATSPSAATATPVWTTWVRPLSARSIRRASAASAGLPRISPSTSTAVSAPITTASGWRAADGGRLGDGEAADEVDGGLARQRRLVDVGRDNGEVDAEQRQQLTPARRPEASTIGRPVMSTSSLTRAPTVGAGVMVAITSESASPRWRLSRRPVPDKKP